MKFFKSLLIGIVIAIAAYVVLLFSIFAFYGSSLGLGALLLPTPLLLFSVMIVIGSIIIGILAQANKIEKGVLSKPTRANIVSWIVVGCIALGIIVLLLKQAGILCTITGMSQINC